MAVGVEFCFVAASPYFCVCAVLLAVSVVEEGYPLRSDVEQRGKTSGNAYKLL